MQRLGIRLPVCPMKALKCKCKCMLCSAGKAEAGSALLTAIQGVQDACLPHKANRSHSTAAAPFQPPSISTSSLSSIPSLCLFIKTSSCRHAILTLWGSRISAANLPQGRCRTPRYLTVPPLSALTPSAGVGALDELLGMEPLSVMLPLLTRRREEDLRMQEGAWIRTHARVPLCACSIGFKHVVYRGD